MFELSLLLSLLPLIIAAIRRIAYDAELLARTPQAICQMFKHEQFKVYESVIRLRYILIAIIIAAFFDVRAAQHAAKTHTHASGNGFVWTLAVIAVVWLLPIGLYIARAIRWGVFAADPLRVASVPVRVTWAIVPATISTLTIAPLRKLAFAHDPSLSHHGHVHYLPPGVAGVGEIAIPLAAAIFVAGAIAVKVTEGVSVRSLLQRTPYKKGSVDNLMDDLMRDLRSKTKVG